MVHVFWWLTGERRILATNLPQYRQVGLLVEFAGVRYRITRVVGLDVWGRPVAADDCCDEAVVIESPLKHVRRARMQA